MPIQVTTHHHTTSTNTTTYTPPTTNTTTYTPISLSSRLGPCEIRQSTHNTNTYNHHAHHTAHHSPCSAHCSPLAVLTAPHAHRSHCSPLPMLALPMLTATAPHARLSPLVKLYTVSRLQLLIKSLVQVAKEGRKETPAATGRHQDVEAAGAGGGRRVQTLHSLRELMADFASRTPKGRKKLTDAYLVNDHQ